MIDIEDPRFVLDKIRQIKKQESNETHTSVRAQLYNQRMKQRERVTEFMNKFGNIILEYKNCVNAVSLT